MIRTDQIKNCFHKLFPKTIVTVDSHTQGESTRLILGGVDKLGGSTMKEKRENFASRYDHVRLFLTREPRGHRDLFAAAVTEPVSKEALFGLVYMDAQRYPYLCGHATIGAVTTLVEIGAITAAEGESIVIVDTPSGPVKTYATIRNGLVSSVAIDMVPSFVLGTNYGLDIPGLGQVSVDLVCVGGFFAMINADDLNLRLAPDESQKLIRLGMTIIDEANRQLRVHHPQRQEVNTVDVVEFFDEGPGEQEGCSVVIYGESHMDRSPCGTGTSAKMTLLHHLGKLQSNEKYTNRSPLGTSFRGYVSDAPPVGNYPAVIARVEGSAQITGYHQFVVDARDPFPHGFLL